MPRIVSGINDQVIFQLEERFETDRFGVDSIMLKVEIPDALFPAMVLRNGSAHPRFTSMALSRRSGARSTPGFWAVSYTFEGFLFELPTPVYELQASLDQDPIQSHPDFHTVIAGTPAAPLNGAVFLDPETNLPTDDNIKGVFREFAATLAGERNPKAGIESYLVPGAEWRETSFAVSDPTELSDLGTIDTPSGPNPTLSGRNWLAWSETYQKRGYIYQISKVWKLSGRNGFDPEIY